MNRILTLIVAGLRHLADNQQRMENDMITTKEQFDADLAALEASVAADKEIGNKVLAFAQSLQSTAISLTETVALLQKKVADLEAQSAVDFTDDAARIATIKDELDAAAANGTALIGMKGS